MRNYAPNPQCNKCSRDVMIIVAGKVARAVFSKKDKLSASLWVNFNEVKNVITATTHSTCHLILLKLL